MKVYVVQRHWDYEGADLIGVYSTPEKAEQAVCDGYEKTGGNCVHYDWKECDVQ